LAGGARAMTAPAPAGYRPRQVWMVRRGPPGVVGGVSPWDYPPRPALRKRRPPVALGKTPVLKPCPLTPVRPRAPMDLTTGSVPAGVVDVLLGRGAVVGAALAQNPGIDMMSLTGSVASGQAVSREASQTLTPVHLELGGKAPVVVFDDADLDKVAEGIRMAG